MNQFDVDEVPAGRIWVADHGRGARVGRGVGQGVIAAGCIFALGWAWAPRTGHVAFDKVLREPWFQGVAQWCFVGCFVGGLIGQVRLGPRFKQTCIGFVLGGLTGVFLSYPLPHSATPTLILCGPMIGGFIGFFRAASRRTEDGIVFEVRSDRRDRPPLWDREMDG